MKNFFFILIIFLIVITIRIIFINEYRYCDADESTVGIMAKHISEGKIIPFYFYGQSYCGGTVVEAITTALLFKGYGTSDIVFKLNAILYYSIYCCLVFYCFKKFFGFNYAIILCLIMIISPESIKISFSNRGYQPLNIIILINMILFFNLLAYYKAYNKINVHVISVLCLSIGFSLWIFEHSLIFIANVIIFSIFIFKLKEIIKCLKYIIPFFIIGYLPTIAYNFLNNFKNWKSIISYKSSNTPFVFKDIYSIDLPSSFLNNNIDDYRIIASGVPLPAKIIALVFIFSLIFLLLYSIKKIYFNYKNNIRLNTETILSTFLINYILIFNIFYFFNGSLESSPRYFWVIFPFFYFIIIHSLFILKKHKFLFIIFSILIFSVFIFHSYFDFWSKKKSPELGSCLNSIGKAEKVSGHSLNKIINLLKRNKINFIYSNYFISWPIIFHSNEKIIALSIDLPGCRYKDYLNIAKKIKPQAIILFSDDPINDHLKIKSKRIIKIDNFFVYLL